MKRFGKWLLAAAGLLVVLVIAAVILVKVLVTPERIRETVLPLAEKHLDREVQLGTIEVSLFSGIVLSDLAVAARTGDENFVAADKVVLRYSLWPLLAGRVVVDEVRLEKPRIRIARLADGSFNFSDLVSATEGAPGKTSPPAATGDGSAVNLLVSTIRVVDGELVFLDYALHDGAPYRQQLTGLTVEVSDLSLDKPFPFALRARINEGSLKLEGIVEPGTPGGEAQVVIQGIDAATFSPYYADLVPGTLHGMTVGADLTVSGKPTRVNSKGTLRFEKISLDLEALPDVPLREADVVLDYDLSTDLDAGKLEIGSSRLDFNGITANLSGEVADYATAPRVDLQLTLPGLELRPALDALPAGLFAPAAGLDPAGTLDVRLHLAGPVAKPRELLQDGSLQLDKIQASLGGLRPALSGTLNLNGSRLHSKDLQLVAGDNRADLDLRAAGLLQPPVQASLAVTADQFNLDPLLAAGAPAGEEPAQIPEEGESRELGPFDIPLRLDTNVNIARATLKGLAVEDFVMHALLESNVLTVDRLTGRIAGGRFSNTARVDLGRKGLAYQARLNLEGLQSGTFLAAFQPKLEGLVSGTLNLESDLAWTGSSGQAIRRTLDGRGEALLADGRLAGGSLTRGLATILGIDSLSNLAFESWAGNFRVNEGQVRIDSLLQGDQVKLAPQGTVGLDGGLDLALDARLAPALAGRLDTGGKVTRFLEDDQGWTRVPLKLGGNLANPGFTVDARAAAEEAGRELKQKLEKKLLERFAPQKGETEAAPDQSGTEQTPDSGKKSLEDAVKGLFGN